MKKALVFIILIAAFISVFPQATFLHDTAYFRNHDKNIRVVHTTNRQYYNDSACVWEITWPVITGTGNPGMEAQLNLEFAGEVSFGDCTKEKCDLTTMDFPRLSRYWDRVEIIGISNDLLSYRLSEGSCPVNSKLCMRKTTYLFYDLKKWEKVNLAGLLKQDEKTAMALDLLILDKLEFVPDDPDIIRSARQFYIENGKVFVFYDEYTLGREKSYTIEIPCKDLLALLSPASSLSLFCNKENESQK